MIVRALLGMDVDREAVKMDDEQLSQAASEQAVSHDTATVCDSEPGSYECWGMYSAVGLCHQRKGFSAEEKRE